MKTWIILLCLMFSPVHAYEYLNGMLLDDIQSENKFRIGYASGFIRGIASTYKAVCIPLNPKPSVFETVVTYIENDIDSNYYPVKIATKMALIDKWECP